MDLLSIYKTHLKLIDGILISNIEEYPGFLVIKSHLNDNWYDSITITNPSLVNWDNLRSNANQLKENRIDYALYFPLEFLKDLEPRIGSTFKRVGGDSYLVLKKVSNISNPTTSELVIKPVSIKNFSDYKDLINEIHGKEMGWPAASSFGDRMFKVQESNLYSEKKVELFVAYYEGIPVGYSSSITSKELNITYLTASGVLSKYRGKGIYTQMVSSTLSTAKEQGIDSAYVITGQESKSWNVARRLGYEEIGRFEYYLPNSI